MDGDALIPRLEQVEDDYVTYLQGNLADWLTIEEAYWTTHGTPLPLPMPDPVTGWHTGEVPQAAITYVITSVPAITVEAVTLEPFGESLGRINALLVRCYTIGQTPETANRLNHRYGRALQRCIGAGRPPGIKGVQPVTLAVAETGLVPGREAYIKGALVTAPLIIGAML